MTKGFIDRRLENQFDKQLKFDEEDTRLKTREKGRLFFRDQWWEPVFCASCSKLYGYVTADWSPHVWALCNDCAVKFGPPPGAVEVSPEDEAAMRGQVKPS